MALNQSRFRTEVITDKFTLEWEIKGFRLLGHKPGEAIKSPVFKSGGSKIAWHLKLYPRGEVEELKDFISLFLFPERDNSDSIDVKIEFVTYEQNKIFTENKCSYTYTNNLGYGYRKFCRRERLIELLDDDSFTIRCVVEQAITVQTILLVKPSFSSELEKHVLREDCQHLLKTQEEFSDVKIIVKDEEIPAHKCLLAARSSVFAGMFRHANFEENEENRVEIKDMEAEVVHAMLEFIYTDEVKNLADLADGLIAAAHKYDLPRLKTMCEAALCESLDTKNAASILRLADLYGSRIFLNYVIDFVANCFRRGQAIKYFEKIRDPDLLLRVTNAMVAEDASKVT